ncbi:PadR family transcriptional regulator [Amycolatopsis sp. CA-230715]|uniref:PadR family transcriptional regulator n=1 Tax=Amycolatopsis sp. CA-230715 TaxID=2745196 RepID=UPI001C02DC9F|nr:helix-turn-helix transcriptional regulator [Amycolatopsis sp. CA-230715]QWF84000.1 hypothetical protein HUW46_07444 [Amycolatopsis sp. CA-230715]
MSLRHALLGLLVRDPASGYDLTKEFEGALGQFAWQARHSQIYPELKRLTGDGSVEVVSEGARGRKTYAVTEDGRAEFRDWMMRTPETGARNEFILRLFLVSSLDREDAKALLRGYADAADEQVSGIRGFLRGREDDWESDPLDHGHLAADYSLRIVGAIRDWALAALDRIEAAEAGRRKR